jgi:hypothetical protein
VTVVNSVTVGRLDRLEYRLVARMGTWYCAKRGVSPTEGLIGAIEISSVRRPPDDTLLVGGGYAFRMWCRIMYVLVALLIVFGFLFDGFFYTRTNIAPYVVLAVVAGASIAVIVEIGVLKLRLGFLVPARVRSAELPRRVFPHFYDFWFAVVVLLIAVPAVLFGPLHQTL